MAQHPYVPQSLELPGFVPNLMSVTQILGTYGIASLIVVLLSWFLSGRCRHLLTVDRILICWWVFTGLTHFVLEGYFVFTPDFFQKTEPIFLAEVWKEYSRGDSRYAARDTTVVVVEGITAVLEGPASILAAYAIITRKSYSYPLQLAVSLGQLYGCIVYYFTPLLDGKEYHSGPFYFWFYYIFMNFIWIVIPLLIAIRAWRKIIEALNANKNGKKKN